MYTPNGTLFTFYSANHNCFTCYTSGRFCFVGTSYLRRLACERQHERAYRSSPRVLSKLDKRKQFTKKCILAAFLFLFFYSSSRWVKI